MARESYRSGAQMRADSGGVSNAILDRLGDGPETAADLAADLGPRVFVALSFLLQDKLIGTVTDLPGRRGVVAYALAGAS